MGTVNQSSSVLARGSMWITAGEVLNAITSTVSTVIAARVLTPDDFGIVGIAILSLAVLEAFTNTGFQQALIQRRDGDIEKFLNTAWTWQLLRGLLLATLMAVSATWLSRWYDAPGLPPILWVCAAVPVINGLGNVGVIAFSRQLDFKRLFFIQAARVIFQLFVSIPAILILRSEWALVAGFVGSAIVGCIISYVAHPFRPRLAFDAAKSKELVQFGKWVTGGTLISFLITQGDDLFVGKMLGTTALGFYQFAYHHANIPATKITHVLGQVSFPTYSRLQEDKEGLQQAFRNVTRFTILLASPLTVFLWFAVPHLVQHVIGTQWTPVIPLVRILALAGLIRAVAALAGALFLSAGRPELDFRMNVPRLVIIAATIYPLTMWKGLEGTSVAILLGVLFCFPTWIYGVRKITGLSMLTLLRDNVLAAVASGLLALSFILVTPRFDMSPMGSLLTLLIPLAASLAALRIVGWFAPSLDVFQQARSLRATLMKR